MDSYPYSKDLSLSAASLCSDANTSSSPSRFTASPVSFVHKGPSPFARKKMKTSLNDTFVVEGSQEDEEENDTSTDLFEGCSIIADSSGFETTPKSSSNPLNVTFTLEVHSDCDSDEQGNNESRTEVGGAAEEEMEVTCSSLEDFSSVVGTCGSVSSSEFNKSYEALESDSNESFASASSSDHGFDTTLEDSEYEHTLNVGASAKVFDDTSNGFRANTPEGMNTRRKYSLRYTRSYLEKLKEDENNNNNLFANDENTFNGTVPSNVLEPPDGSDSVNFGNETPKVFNESLCMASPSLPTLRYARMLDESVVASTEPVRLFDQPKVIEAIVRGLKSIQDVIRVRLVNSKWRNAATTVMHERNGLHLQFSGSSPDGASQCDGASGKEEENSKTNSVYERIESLCSVIENSNHFPVYRFTFREVDLEDAAVKKFFKLQGPSVRFITFRLHPSTRKETLWQLLRNRLVNIVLLELINFPVAWKKGAFVYEYTLDLPYLQVLTFGDSPQEKMSLGAEDLIQSIIQGTEGHLRIINFPVYLNNVLKAEKKFTLIKTLNFSPDPKQEGRKLEDYIALSRKILQLYRINVLNIEDHVIGLTGPMKPEEGTALEDLLCFSRKSLHVIQTQPLGSCPNVKLGGTYSNLHSLHLHCFSSKVKRRLSLNTSFLPSNLKNLGEKFPKLRLVEVVGLECRFFPYDFPIRAFPPESFPTVTELVLRFEATGAGTLEEWQRFAGILPNVKSLTLDLPLASLGGILSKAWRCWKGLEEITIWIKEDGFQYSYPFLDEIITGIEEKYCEIFRQRKTKGSPILVQSVRNKHSILDLPSLKTFDVVFESKEAYEKHVHGNPGIISNVASWHGFTERRNPVTGIYKCKPAPNTN